MTGVIDSLPESGTGPTPAEPAASMQTPLGGQLRASFGELGAGVTGNALVTGIPCEHGGGKKSGFAIVHAD